MRLSLRTWILTAGPVVLVGSCYWLAIEGRGAQPGAVLASHVEPLHDATRPELSSQDLGIACELTASELSRQLGDGCSVIVRSPYVLGGDMSQQDLEHHYQETILPTAGALSVSYVDYEPSLPIVLLMFSNETSYRESAQRLDGRRAVNYHGYYQREHRRSLLNIGTGSGTLAHELTHALTHADFPAMPEWFDEGLASLHEESEFSDDGRFLVGLANWRLYYLIDALQRDRLPSLESLVRTDQIRGEREAVAYAQARYLCLYLQQRGLLAPFYRKFRSRCDVDPTGERTLCALLQVDSLVAADEAFRRWVSTLPPTAASQ